MLLIVAGIAVVIAVPTLCIRKRDRHELSIAGRCSLGGGLPVSRQPIPIEPEPVPHPALPAAACLAGRAALVETLPAWDAQPQDAPLFSGPSTPEDKEGKGGTPLSNTK